MEFLRETKDGKLSTKRLAGLSYLAIAAFLAISDQFTNKEINFEVWITIVGTGLILLGITLGEKINKFRGIN